MESSIAVFLLRQLACELLPTHAGVFSKFAAVATCVKGKVKVKKGRVARVLRGRGHCIPF